MSGIDLDLEDPDPGGCLLRLSLGRGLGTSLEVLNNGTIHVCGAPCDDEREIGEFVARWADHMAEQHKRSKEKK